MFAVLTGGDPLPSLPKASLICLVTWSFGILLRWGLFPAQFFRSFIYLSKPLKRCPVCVSPFMSHCFIFSQMVEFRFLVKGEIASTLLTGFKIKPQTRMRRSAGALVVLGGPDSEQQMPGPSATARLTTSHQPVRARMTAGICQTCTLFILTSEKSSAGPTTLLPGNGCGNACHPRLTIFDKCLAPTPAFLNSGTVTAALLCHVRRSCAAPDR